MDFSDLNIRDVRLEENHVSGSKLIRVNWKIYKHYYP